MIQTICIVMTGVFPFPPNPTGISALSWVLELPERFHAFPRVNINNAAHYISEKQIIIYLSTPSVVAPSKLARAQEMIQIDFDSKLW